MSDKPVLNLSPEMLTRLREASRNLFNPPNGAELLRSHKELMAEIEQEMADEYLAQMPCSETKQ